MNTIDKGYSFWWKFGVGFSWLGILLMSSAGFILCEKSALTLARVGLLMFVFGSILVSFQRRYCGWIGLVWLGLGSMVIAFGVGVIGMFLGKE